MKILIFMSGGFDTYGPSRHLYDALISDMLAEGIQIHLIESHSSGKDPDVPEYFLNNSNFSYETVNTKVVKKSAFAKRYLTGVRYCYKARKRLKKCKNKFDLVFVQSCPWAPFAVPFAKKLTKTTTIWNIQDMFPGSAVATGVMKNTLMQKIFYKFHKRAYKKADHIVVISEDMKKKVIQQGVPKEKIDVISDWFDDCIIPQGKEIAWEDNKFVKKYNLDKNKFYVQFGGTMGYNFDYKMVINVAKLLRNEKDIEFQMVGFGSQMDIFKETAKNEGLENIVFYPLQSQNEAYDVYSACSVCIIPFREGVIGNSVPSKAGLLMSCKKPIIATSDEDSDYNNMINSNNLGFAFGCHNPEKVAEGIMTLKNNETLRKEQGINGYNYAKVIYSRSYNTGKYIELFKKMVNSKDSN